MKCPLALLLAILALLPALHAEEGDIMVETKFIETSIAVTPPLDDAALARMKDVDILGAPRVTMKPDQNATVEVFHEERVPPGEIVSKETVKTGNSLEVIARFKDGAILYRLRLTKCELVNAAAQPAGVMETVSRDIYATGTAKSSEPVWLSFASPKTGRQTLVRVTFTRAKS